MPYFQTLPDFERNEKLLKLLMLFIAPAKVVSVFWTHFHLFNLARIEVK